MRAARFAVPLGDGQVECGLCAHRCRLAPGETGLCRVRHNVGGELRTSADGKLAALALEPVEKKYLFHVRPGAQALTLGTPGCNLGCVYCINWRVSQTGAADGPAVTAAEVVEQAQALGAGCVAFSYTEPTIFFEYAAEVAALARTAGLTVVAKSNGYMTPPVLREMAEWLDAINIDLKGWRDATHRRLVGGSVGPVLENLRLARRLGVWLEIATLVVPGVNDSAEELVAMARFIADELGPETPWHLLRFFPNYQLADTPPTSSGALERAADAGCDAGLHHVYTREVGRGRMLHTRCPHCQSIVIERRAYGLLTNHLVAGCCGSCGRAVPGVGLGGTARGMP